MSVILLSTLYLCSTALHPLQPGNMCGVDLVTMQQLLADQRRDLIKDMREQIVSEVTNQLAPHVARLDQLQNDHNLLKKQLSDIYSKLRPSPRPVPAPVCQSTSEPLTADPVPGPQTLTSVPDVAQIDKARRTLSFYPIFPDFPPPDNSNPNTNEKVLLNYLQNCLAIPPSVACKLTSLDISYLPDKNEITAAFLTYDHVKTIFRHVKNLPPSYKVSLSIPPALSRRYKQLCAMAYHLRNGITRHKTVIRYHGTSLALFARPAQPDLSSSWQQITPRPAQPASTTLLLSPKNSQTLTMS